VTDDDLVRVAAGQLYSAEPDAFIERRTELVAQARSAGNAPAAKSIAALRKPTRSAWVLNQLARAEPGATGQLERLGEDLRAAQRALDGAALRELSLQRRRLIGALAARAFAVCGLTAPPVAVRDEVTATLGAAMTDPQVADQLRTGTLDRAARRDGFGPDAPAPLTVVRAREGRGSTAGPGRAPAAKAAARPTAGHAARQRPAATERPAASVPAKPADLAAARKAKEADLAAAREAAERERRRLTVAAAERAAAEADQAADAAGRAELEREQAVELLEEQLADARRDLAGARLAARRARTRQRQARQALGRLRG